jgi:ferritin-like metal-binding protein YciE
MARKMMSLQDLFVEQLRDLHSAETQLVKALPKMAKAAESEELRTAFAQHLEETERQVERLDEIFEQLGERAKGKKCVAMEGLIEEAKELLHEDAEPDVLDAGLICAAQKVEHYEIASYGTVRTWAQVLGNQRAAELLNDTLQEEGAADKKLTALAERGLNQRAQQPAGAGA